MSGRLGLVTDTITFSSVDGPGNRFVVFLQGCNLNCVACHNPYTIGTCDDCAVCVEACPSGALRVGPFGKIAWDASVCTDADRCITVCPRDATPKARLQTVPEIVKAVRRVAPYLSGITVSGGEATLQSSFVRSLFRAVKTDALLHELGITCFIDSNGVADDATWRRLAPVMDGAMIDLKCFDDAIHRRMTGQSNELVLRSIAGLHQRGMLYEVRLLLVPGLNDDPELLAATGQWLASLDPDVRVKVIGFRCHGVRPVDPPLREPTVAELEQHAEVLAAAGLRQLCVV